MKNCTVSKTKSGKYFVSLQCEAKVAKKAPKPTQVGIDLGLKTFVTRSTGEQIDKPKYLHRSERRLKIRQRRLSCKAKRAKPRNHARQPLAVPYHRLRNAKTWIWGYLTASHIASMICNHVLVVSCMTTFNLLLS
jgi:putative transposase